MFWEFKGKSVKVSVLYNVEMGPVEIYTIRPYFGRPRWSQTHPLVVPSRPSKWAAQVYWKEATNPLMIRPWVILTFMTQNLKIFPFSPPFSCSHHQPTLSPIFFFFFIFISSSSILHPASIPSPKLAFFFASTQDLRYDSWFFLVVCYMVAV